MNVQSILSAKGSAVATVQPTSSVSDAIASLRDHGVGALVVSGDGSAIDGILSERDIVRAMADGDVAALGRSVSSCMSGDVVTCRPNDTIDSLMALMTARRIRHVPVVDEGEHLAGIVSIGDVVKARLGELERENDQLHDYIHGNVG